MNKKLILIALTTGFSNIAFADVTIYGKANLALQATDEANSSTTELVSNASRIGFKGSETLTEELQALYQVEYEVAIDDGVHGGGKVFKPRNIYVGLEGGWGKVIAGHFDTPLKTTQKKVDLFNDLAGDIKNVLTKSDNRGKNSLMYSTPKLFDALTISIDFIASEADGASNGLSSSINYQKGNLYLGAAYDSDVENSVDVYRLVAQYKMAALPLQLGALYEDQEAVAGGLRDGDGWVISAQYKLDSDYTLKAQFGESDIVTAGAETLSLGLDYKLSKNTKLFAYFTDEQADAAAKSAQYLGVGMEMKF